MRTCVHAHRHMYMHTHTYIHARNTRQHMHTCAHAHRHTCKHVHTCVHAHRRTHSVTRKPESGIARAAHPFGDEASQCCSRQVCVCTDPPAASLGGPGMDNLSNREHILGRMRSTQGTARQRRKAAVSELAGPASGPWDELHKAPLRRRKARLGDDCLPESSWFQCAFLPEAWEA